MAILSLKSDRRPAFLSYGFRPFFLLGATFAGLAILLWLPVFQGQLHTHSAFAPVDWHIHEMLFGYLPAILTGFLLTAIPNWTGRLPVKGVPLLLLALLWLAGRLAVFLSMDLGWAVAMAIDCGFLLAMASAAAVEITAGRNWRNLKVLAPVIVLFAANVMFHFEAHWTGLSDASRRLGVGAVIVLIIIVGGRIIPSFTRNWLVRSHLGRLPAPFARFDTIAIVMSALALALWTAWPSDHVVGTVLLLAAALNFARMLRWSGYRTLGEPLVMMLHVAFLFVPVALALAGLAAIFPETIPPAAAFHAFGVGAIGSMTLAVMTRATLGHTGHALKATAGTCGIFCTVVLAAVLRIGAVFTDQPVLLYVSAGLWIMAFLGFAIGFGPMLMRPRLRDGAGEGAP